MEKMNLTIRRLGAVNVHPGSGVKQPAMLAAMLKNVQAFGFTFTGRLFGALLTQTEEFLVAFYQELILVLKTLVGADKEYTPFYPNFPEQVAEADDAELIVNAIIHYLSSGTLIPDYPKKARFPLIGDYSLKEIDVCTDEDIMKVFTSLLSSNVSISNQDKEDICWFVENTNYKAYLPEEIPMKETKAFFGNLMLQKGDTESAKVLYKTATDVLRLLAAMSDQDISLADHIRFRKLKRPERRFVMDLLANCASLEEDMFRNRELWVIAGEIVHPGEYFGKAKYEKVVSAFDKIRKDDKPLFFAGQVETAVKCGDWNRATKLLSSRPGDFARRLDQLLRISGADADTIVNAFSAVADKVATRVLWQAKAHFDHRSETGKRAFFPKGNEAKCRLVNDDLAGISEEARKKASDACYQGILKQYASKEAMGNVYVDPTFKAFAAPFAQRSASSGFKQVARGSRLPLSEGKKIVRPFIWWTNTEDDERVDIDLSCLFLDENFAEKSEVTYYHVKNDEYKAYHSGDITNGGKFGGKGVSEFVDIEPDFLVEKGVRYAVVMVNMYSAQPFSATPCCFGWMERNDAMSGEVYDPKTVENCISLTANSTLAIPAIIDCKTKEVVWADMMCKSRCDFGGNNVASNVVGSAATAWAIVNWEKPSIYDIVLANAVARGTVVENRNDADIIFSNDPTKPIVKVVVKDDDGNETVQEAEKAVTIRDAYDLAYYMGEML